MKKVAIAAVLGLALSGCAMLGKNSGALQADLVTAATCVGEVQAAAPACVAEVPSCVALSKTLVKK